MAYSSVVLICIFFCLSVKVFGNDSASKTILDGNSRNEEAIGTISEEDRNLAELEEEREDEGLQEDAVDKRKWGDNNMRVWGKRTFEGTTEEEKRKWGDNNMRVWGKRKWGDNNMRVWGKRQWGDNNMRVWGKRQWGDNNMRVWGKRSAGVGKEEEGLESMIEDRNEAGEKDLRGGIAQEAEGSPRPSEKIIAAEKALATRSSRKRRNALSDYLKRTWNTDSLRVWGKRDVWDMNNRMGKHAMLQNYPVS